MPLKLFFFSLYTYLAMARMLKNILRPNARAPLHIGDSSACQYPAGSWIAEFLIASQEEFSLSWSLVLWTEEEPLIRALMLKDLDVKK